MRTFAMASILLTTLVLGAMQPRLRRGAQKPSRAAEQLQLLFLPAMHGQRLGQWRVLPAEPVENPYWTGRTVQRRYRRGD